MSDIKNDLATSVDDLRSTLGCAFSNGHLKLDYLTRLLAACHEKSKRGVIETFIRKVQKTSPRPAATSGPDEEGQKRSDAERRAPAPGTSIHAKKTEQGQSAHTTPEPGALAAPVAGMKTLTLAGLDAPAPFVGEDEDAMLGRQLTDQWAKVVGGQREQLIFGAMMIKLRARISSARGQVHPGGAKSKGTGIDGWLGAHAPKVARSTAYRLMEIAEGVQAEFKLGSKVDLEALLAAQVENLDDKLAKKRAAIEQCIEGQSQRQLLLTFGKEQKHRGGDTSGKAVKLTPEEKLAQAEAAVREDATVPFKLLSEIGDAWHILNEAELTGAIDIAEEWLAKARARLKLPPTKRPVLDVVGHFIARHGEL